MPCVAALQDLGRAQRDVFMLFRLEQMKHGEIAQLYGISVSPLRSTSRRQSPIWPAVGAAEIIQA